MTDNERLAAFDAQYPPVTPTYCRHPDCSTVVSVPHPLTDGWELDVVCVKHRDTDASRYSGNLWSPEQLSYVPTPGLCVSCRAPISSKAEWCCEPCAIGSGHSDTCRAKPRLRIVKGGDPS